jgi:hypothetical protein
MAKQVLTGTLEEQCEFLYNMAQEKLAQENFTGAYYALKEVVKHSPNFRDAAALLAQAKQKKSRQSKLVLLGFAGAALFVGIGTFLQISNDLILLALALAGAVVGYMVGLSLPERQPSAVNGQ